MTTIHRSRQDAMPTIDSLNRVKRSGPKGSPLQPAAVTDSVRVGGSHLVRFFSRNHRRRTPLLGVSAGAWLQKAQLLLTR